MQSVRDRANLHKIIERKAEIAVRGERLAQGMLYEAEAEVQAKYWETRKSDIALHELVIRISTISATTSKSMGRSGSQRSKKFMQGIAKTLKN